MRHPFLDSDPFPGPAPCRVPLASSRELRQESHVVLEEQPDIVDAVLQHGDALDTEPEGEAGDALGVVAHPLQNTGMHHAGAAHFDEARALATVAACARAEN